MNYYIGIKRSKHGNAVLISGPYQTVAEADAQLSIARRIIALLWPTTDNCCIWYRIDSGAIDIEAKTFPVPVLRAIGYGLPLTMADLQDAFERSLR